MMFGQAPVGLPQVQPLPNAPTPQFPTPDIQAPPKRGMFGGVQIDLGRAIAGYLAGIGNPAGVQALQAMNERQREQERIAQEQAQYQREHQDKRDDFTFEQDYKAAHDTPDIQQRIAVLNAIHPGLGDTYAQNYARNGGGLGLVTSPVTGQQYMPAGTGGPMVGAVEQGFRFKGGNAADPSSWEPVGGQTASPSGNFPGDNR